MQCTGRIELDRELSYSHARKITDLATTKQYPIELSINGRAIQWDKRGDPNQLANAMIQVISNILEPAHINGIGIILIYDDKRRYELIVLGHRIKIYEDGQIRHLYPPT